MSIAYDPGANDVVLRDLVMDLQSYIDASATPQIYAEGLEYQGVGLAYQGVGLSVVTREVASHFALLRGVVGVYALARNRLDYDDDHAVAVSIYPESSDIAPYLDYSGRRGRRYGIDILCREVDGDDAARRPEMMLLASELCTEWCASIGQITGSDFSDIDGEGGYAGRLDFTLSRSWGALIWSERNAGHPD